MITNQHN